MKKILLVSLLTLPLFGLSQYTYDHLRIRFLLTDSASKHTTYENLRLYPIYAKESFSREFQTIGKYMTLQEAIEKKKVRITEKNNGGTVGSLNIENTSNDTIIVITGDVVKGGQQDRIINKDLVLAPESGKKDLDVYCVESGRWSAASSGRVSSQNLSLSAPAEFNTHHNKGSMSLRKVVEKEKDQSKVWSKVEEINNLNKTTTSTKTYTAITNSQEYNKKLVKYLAFFKNKFISEPAVIGVVVVTGNKVLGCDMFATHDLFAKQFESLLHSYATEAILNGKPVSISPTVVKVYMDNLLADEKVQEKTLKEKGNSFVEKGKKLRVSSFD